MEKMHIKLNVNGKDVDLLTEPRTLLITLCVRNWELLARILVAARRIAAPARWI